MGGVCTSHKQEMPFEPLQANSEAPTPVATSSNIKDATSSPTPFQAELDSKKRSGSFDQQAQESTEYSSQTVGMRAKSSSIAAPSRSLCYFLQHFPSGGDQ